MEGTEVLATRNKKSEVLIDKKEIETSGGRGDLVCSEVGMEMGEEEMEQFMMEKRKLITTQFGFLGGQH